MVQRCDFSPGECIDHQYVVERVLGEGAFGKVFKVQTDNGKTYALKLLKLWEIHPDLRKQLTARFTMEFETGQIQSKYLVHSLAYGYVNENPYIVMEFCPKGDLLQYLQKEKLDFFEVGRLILLGLNDLHKCGKVHRDLKPENVLVRADGGIALTDFGISGDRNKRMTERNILGKPKQVFGTYAYIPPEQVNPRRDATVLPTTDIFSFGVMMYQLLTNELPFGLLNDETDLGTYLNNAKQEHWNRNRLVTCSHEGQRWLTILSLCLKADFRERIQSVDELLKYFPSGCHTEEQCHKADTPIATTATTLRIMQGEEYGKCFRLSDYTQQRKIVTIGRKEEDIHNTIPLQEYQYAYISRKHCTLELNEGIWYIRDGQWSRNAKDMWKPSLNGTFVNSTEVDKKGMPLHIGDIISVGEIKIRVENT